MGALGRTSEGWRLGVGLSITPLVVGLAALGAPTMRVGAAAADMIAFAGAAVTAVLGIAIAATAEGSRRVRMAAIAAAVALLVGFAYAGVQSRTAAVGVDAALVAASWAIGVSIGRNIQHPGHLFPACVVVGFADLASIISRSGPTHAIAESDRALSIVAVSFPVLGTTAFAPALGAGDLVFMAMVLGAARAHGLPFLRATVLCLLGTFIAAAASALLETAIPALVPIGVVVVLGLPAVRNLRQEDRRIAFLAMALAASIAVAAIAARLPALHLP